MQRCKAVECEDRGYADTGAGEEGVRREAEPGT